MIFFLDKTLLHHKTKAPIFFYHQILCIEVKKINGNKLLKETQVLMLQVVTKWYIYIWR
jgi:hypothetical protein